MKVWGYEILTISTVLQDFIMDVGWFSKGSFASLQKARGHILETYYDWVLVNRAGTPLATKNAPQDEFLKQCHPSTQQWACSHCLCTTHLEYLYYIIPSASTVSFSMDHPEEASKKLSASEKSWRRHGVVHLVKVHGVQHSQRINNF